MPTNYQVQDGCHNCEQGDIFRALDNDIDICGCCLSLTSNENSDVEKVHMAGICDDYKKEKEEE